MIILNPITFQEILIDETQLTAEQSEIFKKINSLTKIIIRLQGEQSLEVAKMEACTQMRFKDMLNKVKLK